MGKIKFQGGITKLVTASIGKRNKLLFSEIVEENLHIITDKLKFKASPIDLVSFSSSRDFYDQILSILTFIRYVGYPKCWTIYSDGSHTPHQVDLLENQFTFLKVEKTDWEDSNALFDKCKNSLLPYKEYLVDYGRKQPLGKKLFHYLNHEVSSPTLFIDSDILFYHRAYILQTILANTATGWYLPDTDAECLDSRYKKKRIEQLYSVNSGFFLLNNNLTYFAEGLEFLKSLNKEYEYFTEQTVEHIVLNSNNLMPLDPRAFVLNIDDQFDFSYTQTREAMAIRHYTGPVRHKMWQRNWRWHLSL